MFCCPNCGGQRVEADDPGSYIIYCYSDDGQVVDCQSYPGETLMNHKCPDCNHPFNEDEWRSHALEKQHVQ